ncbi:glycosyltransferase family 1 protein [Halalkalibacter sp. APA_J-10(15)]|uniref:glycosyltransferase family 1 protein n=1 Tax=unclassified Halalkalibacter TaxID=2893063 RepID=UPI001FF485E6|nr:glycosyltransferase family 1 protein [Halalkalibacter sp. APA_J-10(15)]MCK0470355.1 glycosyltransferase family 1 protein [Halalkalibacter sp. APA_J-10(15)]
MKPIRVLQVVTIMNRGGLETMLMNYYRRIDRERIQFDFIVHREEEGHYDQEILDLGGCIYRMPPIRPGQYRTYFTMLELFFHEHRYVIVHSHINENSAFILKIAKEAGVPCRIAHSHLSDLAIDYKLPFRIYARRVLKNQPTTYFACSKRAGEWLFGKEIATKDIKVLHNAVDVNKFAYDPIKRKKKREELGIQGKFVIGHIGRFNRQKNHKFLIEIFKKVYRCNQHAVLVLVGDGSQKSNIIEKVRRAGIEEAVFFLGVREDIPDLMLAFDLFLFPSLFEGLPVVLIEAQAAGLRCIVSDAITKEVDVTNRIDFFPLSRSPSEWSEYVLSVTGGHKDMSEQLRENNYDTCSMVDWLTGYYLAEAKRQSV